MMGILFLTVMYLSLAGTTLLALLFNRDEMGKKDYPSNWNLVWSALTWPVILYKGYWEKK